MKPPAFQFYPAEFLSDENVVLMTNQEIGCYVKLLCYCWREGSIPNDIPKIAKLCGEDGSAMAQLWRAIEPCFRSAIGDPFRLVNLRLEEERKKQEEFRKERSETGKIGANKRWLKHLKNNGSAMKQPMAKNGSSSSSSSLNSTVPSDVEEIYSAYPRKVSKKDALIAIAKALKKSPKDVLLRKTIEFAESVKGEEPKYIPHPATWFNKERFNDEMELFKPKSDVAIRYANHPCNKDSKNFTYNYTPEQAEEFQNLKAEYERQIAS